MTRCNDAVSTFWKQRGGEKWIYNLVGKPEGKTQLERPWRRWEDNIKINFQEIFCGLHSAWSEYGLVNMEMNSLIP